MSRVPCVPLEVVSVARQEPAVAVELTQEVFECLLRVQRMATIERRILERVPIVLYAHWGCGNSEIAATLALSPPVSG